MFELNQQQPCTEIFQGHRNYSLIQLPFDPYQSSLRLYEDRVRPRHPETSQSGAIQLKETNTEKNYRLKNHSIILKVKVKQKEFMKPTKPINQLEFGSQDTQHPSKETRNTTSPVVIKATAM